MKKTIKGILIGMAVIVVILAIGIGSFFYKMKSEIKRMHVPETKEVTQGVYLIKDSFVNMFLVKDSDNYLAIDAGADSKVIESEFKKLKIDPDKVNTVILTHCDGDHTAALQLFKNAKVYFSRQEEQMINGKTYKMMFYYNSIPRKDYTLLDDQQLLTIGKIKIKGILTPGHTPGSMSYLVNDSLLFVGDAFSLKNGKVVKPNEFFCKDMKMAIKSFDKIKNIPTAKYIFTAHTGFNIDYKNAVNTQLK